MTPIKVEEATMPANNLPKMPDGLSGQQRYLASEYGYACYLAGIEAARSVLDENDVAALILSADLDSYITLTDLLQVANYDLGERLNIGLRLARAALANLDALGRE